MSWSIMQASAAMFEVPAGRARATQLTIASVSRPFCRLELDINSAAEYSGTFAEETLAVLLEELTDLAKEISERGDVS